MQLSINKAKTATVITIALLMASIALLVATQPTAKAASTTVVHNDLNLIHHPIFGPLPAGVVPFTSFDTTAHMSMTPNPVGVGEQILVNVWIYPGTTAWLYQSGYYVDIQKPDGSTETIGPFDSYLGDETAWFEYVVDQVGTWKFKFYTAGTYIPKGSYYVNPGTDPPTNPNINLGVDLYYKPCTTDWISLTVQQDWVNSWPSVPIPTDYWTRPIQRENREWWTIGQNYPWTGAHYYANGRVLYSSNYRYTYGVTAPNTAHIVWRRLGAEAGIIGGEESTQYSLGGSGGTPGIIFAGRCYQSISKFIGTTLTSVWECYDLRTGQIFWDQIMTGPIPTNIMYENPTTSSEAAPGTLSNTAQPSAGTGSTPYFVTISNARLYKYTPLTGALSANISLPSGPEGIVSGSSSSMVCNIYNNEWVYWVQGKNATGGITTYRLIKWTMRGSNTNFTTRIASNISWPVAYLGFVCTGGTSRAVDFDAGLSGGGTMCFDMPQGYSGFSDRGGSAFEVGYNISSWDLNTGATYYWNQSSGNNSATTMFEESTCVFDHGKLAFGAGSHWACFDGKTGHMLWTSDLMSDPWGMWEAYSTSSYDLSDTKGEIVSCTYDGVYAIDWDTGHILWHYADPNIPWESPYYSHPFDSGCFIADGKVYAQNSEHSASQPATRGWKLYCINATSGALLWKITSPMSPGAGADGYLVAGSPYDGYTYVFGKGRSATTVAAPDTAVPATTAVLIHGTVMDMSPGDQGSIFNPTAKPDSNTAAGTVPCVSAASMTTQMEYLYMQHPIDGLFHNETLTGVPVILTAIGSDGSVTNIGTTTSNGYYGNYGMSWTPPKADTYTIMATFAGSDSYGSSAAGTTLVVGPAPATPTPTATPPEAAPDNTGLIYATLAGVIIAIIIGIVAVLVGLRKRQ